MFRSLFLTTALVCVTGTAMAQGAHVQGAHVNGTYLPAGGSVTYDAQPMLGSVHGGGAYAHQSVESYQQGYETLGGQYEVAPSTPMIDGAIHSGHAVQAPYADYQTYAPAPTVQTQTIAPGGSQSFTVPAGQNATYNIVVPSAAPATYAQPQVYTAPVTTGVATGWVARGVYVGARAGVASNRDTKFTVAGLDYAPSNTIRTEYDDPGYVGSVVIGYGAREASGWGYRVELEGGFQTAEVDTHTVSGLGKFGGKRAKGDAKTLYGFINAYGDLPITHQLALTAGGGVGVGHVSFNGYGIAGAGKALDDSATALGYHLDAGVTYNLSEQVAVEALYRYQSFVDAEVRTENGNKQKIDLDSHSVLAGVRVGF